MQWLIEIIAARVGETIGWRRREQFANPDFQLGDMIRDNAWHDLDLSAIVPDGAGCIAFEVRLRAAIGGKALRLRRKGNTTEHPRSMESSYAGNINNWSDMSVSCNAGRVIQYRMSGDPWSNFELSVKGWWLTTVKK